MTFRTRPAPKPTRRRARRNDTRRSIYITLSFSLAIAAALSLMGGVFVANYYSDHWAPVAAVNGETISKDTVRARADMNVARFKRQVIDYTTLRNQGKITSDEYTTLSNSATSSQAAATIHTDALTQLENEATLRQYAAKNNITVTDQQVNDQIQVDATLPETRHVMVIAVQPTATPPANTVTAADDTAAQTKAQKLLDEVKAGKKWADVATESGQDAITNANFGDLGLVSKDTLDLDLDMVNAVFGLAKVNDTTPVMKGLDGIYRFATVTTIVPKFVDRGLGNVGRLRRYVSRLCEGRSAQQGRSRQDRSPVHHRNHGPATRSRDCDPKGHRYAGRRRRGQVPDARLRPQPQRGERDERRHHRRRLDRGQDPRRCSGGYPTSGPDQVREHGGRHYC
jgi:hypothetical protein